MKHTLTKGFELNNEELLSSSKIEEIISLRDFKVTNFDLSLFDVYYFDSNVGDDLNDGKSLSSAKKSLLELHNLFKIEKPLLIYINNGSYYKGNISIDRNYPTIISSINNKKAPIIEGDDSVIRIYSSNVKIYGLEICGKNCNVPSIFKCSNGLLISSITKSFLFCKNFFISSIFSLFNIEQVE